MKKSPHESTSQIKQSGLEPFISSSPDFDFTVLVGGFVPFYDVSLDTTAGVYLDAILSCPQSDSFGVRAVLRRLGPGYRTPASASYLAASGGEAGKGLAQFACVTVIKVDLVFLAIKGERYCFVGFRAVDIIFEQYHYLFGHELRLAVW
jgi:hypothetical protein